MVSNHHQDALLWMAPLLSGGDYSSESLGFALGLHNLTRLDGGLMAGVRQFGEPQDESFVEGLPKALIPPLRHLFGAGASQDAASGVVVCHSTPDAWVCCCSREGAGGLWRVAHSFAGVSRCRPSSRAGTSSSGEWLTRLQV